MINYHSKLSDLPRITDRLTFLYLEKCKINRDDGAFTVTNTTHVAHVPSSAISVIMLGPGTEISSTNSGDDPVLM